MIALSLDEVRLIAQIRNTSYENKSKEDLMKVLSELEPETRPETKPETNQNKHQNKHQNQNQNQNQK